MIVFVATDVSGFNWRLILAPYLKISPSSQTLLLPRVPCKLKHLWPGGLGPMAAARDGNETAGNPAFLAIITNVLNYFSDKTSNFIDDDGGAL